jgi:prepilin signal peptidase PulO-like enzyme (type II secretory pathway)
MKLLLNPFFLVAIALYLVNRFLLPLLNLTDYQIPYLNDLLCLPVVLTITLWLQQKLFPRTARSRLNRAQVIFAVVYFAIFFEGILPAFSERYTRDYWDILAYAAGGLLFYFFFNPKPK